MLPLHMLNHAVIAGAATLTFIDLTGTDAWQTFLQTVLKITLLVNLVSTGFELFSPHPTVDSSRVANSIWRGHYRFLFWGGVIGMGTLVPLIDRYAERLAPGTKFADIIGEIDPAKLAAGASMSTESALHFGLIVVRYLTKHDEDSVLRCIEIAP